MHNSNRFANIVGYFFSVTFSCFGCNNLHRTLLGNLTNSAQILTIPRTLRDNLLVLLRLLFRFAPLVTPLNTASGHPAKYGGSFQAQRDHGTLTSIMMDGDWAASSETLAEGWSLKRLDTLGHCGRAVIALWGSTADRLLLIAESYAGYIAYTAEDILRIFLDCNFVMDKTWFWSMGGQKFALCKANDLFLFSFLFESRNLVPMLLSRALHTIYHMLWTLNNL